MFSPLLSSCGDDITADIPGSGQDSVTPAIVGAVAASNTTVYVSFSKSMGDSAAVVGNYVITQENVNPEVGTLIIYDAYFPAGDTEHTGVILETSPQNEVTYRVSSSGVKDANGNAIPGIIETLGGIVNTASVIFPGAAPTPIEIVVSVDSFGAIAGWVDVNGNGVVDAGDSIQGANGSNIVLADANGDQVVDNWADADTSGTITAGDSVSGFQDSDSDGMTDSRELYGESIFIEQANGEVIVVSVTSDPTRPDTDGDGLSDFEEYGIGSSPRATDTDADNIPDYTEWNVVFSNPNAQDSDMDGLGDGLEHNFYHTSPILADSDGDQLSDATELLELNRNPRIADIPKLNISVGQVRLQVDERYSYTNENGEVITSESSTSTSLEESQDRSHTRTDGGLDELSGGADIRAGVGTHSFFGGTQDDNTKSPVGGGIEVTGHVSKTDSTNWQTDDTTSSASQQAYESSLSRGRELSTTRSVSREVVGASIDVDVTISNIGDVPFTLSNLEITVLQQVGRGRFLPVATLVSNSELVTGTPLQVNLGGLSNERGPFLFASREVFPNLVEQLMSHPSALVFRVANYDVTDELGRNYAFSNQVARDRTGSITIDYGDAESARQYLVSTSGALENGEYVGGFNAANGQPLGLPLNYMLESILGIPRHDTTQDRIVAGNNGSLQSTAAADDVLDATSNIITAGPNGRLETRPVGDDYIANPTSSSGILAGLNKTADSIAQGDDVQRVPPGSNGLSIGTIVIDPGENGVLDTPNLNDDLVDFVAGYETSPTCNATSNKAADICRVDADCQCQPGDTDYRCASSPAPVGSCSGPQNLVRVNSLRNGDYNRGWFIVTSGNLPDAADFDQITIEPGNNITLGFLQDLDGDGLFARNEFLYGSTDSSQDNFLNASFGEDFNQTTDVGSDGIADSVDTDHDGLSDYAEAYVGWRVSADGGALRQVYSSPRFADTDGDGLQDPVEQDLRRFCVAADPRSDSLCAFQTQVVSIAEAIGIIAGPDGIADTTADANDEQLIAVGTPVTYGTPVVGPGTDGVISTALVNDDVYESASSIPPATDPASSDTDLDDISDYLELTGFSTNEVIVDGGNGQAETYSNGDDIQRALFNNPVQAGGIVMLSGPNGVIDSRPTQRQGTGDDQPTTLANFGISCGSNLVVDTIASYDDIQLLPYGSSCTSATDIIVLNNNYPNLIDTLPNNLNDDRLRPAIPGLVTDPLRRDTDTDLFTDGLELVYGSNPTVIDADDFTDRDFDGLTDNEETSLGWIVSVNGAADFTVQSSPTLPDTDFDGLPDVIERDLRTNPNSSDTDGDGISDYDEINDLSRYASLATLYPALNISATTTSGWGTSPILTDTDGDGLSDYQELIGGFRLTLPGSNTVQMVYTQAIYDDTDLDGMDDGAEIANGTDPTNADTDGDGRSDGAENIVGTNPLEPDLAYRVIFREIATNAGCDDGGAGGELGWWFVLNEPNTTSSILLSDALDTERLELTSNETGAVVFYGEGNLGPDATLVNYLLNDRACYIKGMGARNYWMNFDEVSSTYVLHQGESINIKAYIGEVDGTATTDCGLSPRYIPTNIYSDDKAYRLNKTYFYEDLANAPSGIVITEADATAVVSGTACEINFKLDIEIIR